MKPARLQPVFCQATLVNAPRFTRKQFIGGACSHEDYYGQFVTPQLLAIVKRHANRRLEDMPLPLTLGKAMREAGDYLTSTSAILVLREAVRQAGG